MNNPDLPAYPIVVPAKEKPEFYSPGLTKREHVAIEAMKSLIESGMHFRNVATSAVGIADELLEELEKTYDYTD